LTVADDADAVAAAVARDVGVVETEDAVQGLVDVSDQMEEPDEVIGFDVVTRARGSQCRSKESNLGDGAARRKAARSRSRGAAPTIQFE
jgi:hypothetical protein